MLRVEKIIPTVPSHFVIVKCFPHSNDTKYQPYKQRVCLIMLRALKSIANQVFN